MCQDQVLSPTVPKAIVYHSSNMIQIRNETGTIHNRINIGSRSGYERSGSEPHAKFRAALSHGRIKSGELMTRQEFARKDSAQEGGIFGFGFFIGAPRERGGRVQAGAMTGHFCGAGRKSARFSSL